MHPNHILSVKALDDLLGPILALKEKVEKKSLTRLSYDNLENSPEIIEEGGRFFQVLTATPCRSGAANPNPCGARTPRALRCRATPTMCVTSANNPSLVGKG